MFKLIVERHDKEETDRVMGKDFPSSNLPFNISKPFYPAVIHVFDVVDHEEKSPNMSYDKLRWAMEKEKITTWLEDLKKSWETTKVHNNGL